MSFIFLLHFLLPSRSGALLPSSHAFHRLPCPRVSQERFEARRNRFRVAFEASTFTRHARSSATKPTSGNPSNAFVRHDPCRNVLSFSLSYRGDPGCHRSAFQRILPRQPVTLFHEIGIPVVRIGRSQITCTLRKPHGIVTCYRFARDRSRKLRELIKTSR